jgi:hypothetical protein
LEGGGRKKEEKRLAGDKKVFLYVDIKKKRGKEKRGC